MTPAKLKWYPVSQLPKEPGVYLVWSKKYGARIEKVHPSWWNCRNAGMGERGPRVAMWAYLWAHGSYRHGPKQSQTKSGVSK